MEESALIDKLLDNEHIDLSAHDFSECFNNDIKRLFFEDDVSEIMINGRDSTYIEKGGHLYDVGLCISEVEIQRFLDVVSRMNSRNIDVNHPIFDGRLPGGFRCNVVAPPVSLSGFMITVRKHSSRIRSFNELIELGMMKDEHAALLKKMIDEKMNIIIAGGTGTGKTTLVNVMFNGLSTAEPQRVITIEDTAELKIALPHVISLESRYATPDCPVEIGIRDLVKTALRMRPDRIVIGEVRGEEAYDLLHALNTGHKGTVCTIHANSCRDALRRLETLAVLGHPNLDILVPRSWIASNINVVAYIERVGGSRRLSELKKIEGVEGGNYVLCDLIQ
jgi:pilus assembly protein CpaF